MPKLRKARDEMGESIMKEMEERIQNNKVDELWTDLYEKAIKYMETYHELPNKFDPTQLTTQEINALLHTKIKKIFYDRNGDEEVTLRIVYK